MPPGSASGFVSQGYGFEDPGPYQNVTDPQHCISYNSRSGANQDERFCRFIEYGSVPQYVNQDPDTGKLLVKKISQHLEIKNTFFQI